MTRTRRAGGRSLHVSALIAALLALILAAAVPAGHDWARLRDVAQKRYGAVALNAVTDWQRMIDMARGEPVPVQLGRVNEFWNVRTRFEDDIAVWGQDDYWATPLEMLARGRGDCEDFAIAKYVSLLELGVPQSRLRLIYVRANLRAFGGAATQAHMVLGYYEDPNGEPVILDNLTGRIQPASARPELTPVFSFNGQGLWAGGQKAGSDPTARLSRWRDLLARLADEGFR
ncbi:transglutaminase-like cysteine peptidase [Fontimonas sp. SYSU GA230001]|uniref:transglutaminase-like cysteine peptidase n=1 Tax=Fontimonas sp. SYSU GA230001 TaxID=3142450 RepID=UPI0032B6206D